MFDDSIDFGILRFIFLVKTCCNRPPKSLGLNLLSIDLIAMLVIGLCSANTPQILTNLPCQYYNSANISLKLGIKYMNE
jgi:hypothetical protein